MPNSAGASARATVSTTSEVANVRHFGAHVRPGLRVLEPVEAHRGQRQDYKRCGRHRHMFLQGQSHCERSQVQLPVLRRPRTRSSRSSPRTFAAAAWPPPADTPRLQSRHTSRFVTLTSVGEKREKNPKSTVNASAFLSQTCFPNAAIPTHMTIEYINTITDSVNGLNAPV